MFAEVSSTTHRHSAGSMMWIAHVMKMKITNLSYTVGQRQIYPTLLNVLKNLSSSQGTTINDLGGAGENGRKKIRRPKNLKGPSSGKKIKTSSPRRKKLKIFSLEKKNSSTFLIGYNEEKTFQIHPMEKKNSRGLLEKKISFPKPRRGKKIKKASIREKNLCSIFSPPPSRS